jgi:hypothetical protein
VIADNGVNRSLSAFPALPALAAMTALLLPALPGSFPRVF